MQKFFDKKKIIIGTANFSERYGFFNQTLVHNNEIKKILNYCEKNDINVFDTAIDYNCDVLLGELGIDKFNIISKIGNYIGKENLFDKLQFVLERHIKNLRIKYLDILLLHNPVASIKQNKNSYIKFINTIKKNNLIKKIGYSVYSPKELDFLWNEMDIEAIQFPLNIFDQRFLNSGWISKLKKNNVEIHIRSIFLQGLILKKKLPSYFNNWKDKIDKFHSDLSDNNLSSYSATLNFIMDIPEVDKVVIGVENLKNIEEIFKIPICSHMLEYKKFSIDDEKFVNPSKWFIKQ